MAPMTSTDQLQADVRSRRSILTLDKSDEPYPSLVLTAGEILGISLDKPCRDIDEAQSGQLQKEYTGSDPRHTHALRWLLKKLRPAEAEEYCPRLHLKSWVLLRELLDRTNPTVAARLLKESTFINTLRGTLQWLQENFSQEQSLRFPSVGTEIDGHCHGSANETGPADRQTTARKRKLDGTEVVARRESDRPVVVLDPLYVAICGVVRQLESSIRHLGHVHGYAAEHLRAALKCSPEDAAIVLGSSLDLTNHILQSPIRLGHRRRLESTFGSSNVLENMTFDSCISPLIGFWSLHFPNARGLISEPQNLAFIRYCILPCLHLLHTLQECYDANAEVHALKDLLTRLLVNHVIVPFHESSGFSKRKKLPEVDSAAIFVKALTESLRNFRFHEPTSKIDSRVDRKTKVHLITTCLSLLFHVAITCRPRTTPASRRTESLWLEDLFIQILACASAVLDTSSSAQPNVDFVRLTRWMLRRALDNKVTLGTTTLENILETSAGLLDDDYEKSQVGWGLVSLCLLHDTNVFMNSSATSNQGQDAPSQSPNKYSAALFSHITEGICRRSSISDDDYAFKLEMVVLPLLHAFADARNLSGFIALWNAQLTIIQKRCQLQERTSNALLNRVAIWEHDTLLGGVADLCETNMTVGQIEHLFKQAQQELDSLESASDGLFSSIIILDCMVSGCRRESTRSKLAENARLVFRSLARISAIDPDPTKGYQWRLWRIMAVINGRWNLADESLTPGGRLTLIKAQDLISPDNTKTSDNNELDYSVNLHSFNFLLTFAPSEHLVLRDATIQAIRTVMDIKKFFCQLRWDHIGALKFLDKDPDWSGQSYGVVSLDALYIGCIARLLQSPEALSALDPEYLKRLFDQLYWLSVNRRTSSQPLNDQQIDYDWLWQAVFRSNALGKNARIASFLSGFQATQFLNHLEDKDPQNWNINSVQYLLAFEMIQRSPISALSEEHRLEIANRLLRIMLHRRLPCLAKMTEYIGLLTKVIKHPNNSMAVLNNVCGQPRGKIIEAKTGHKGFVQESALFMLADKISEELWSVDNIDCLLALRRLTQAVMRYLMSTMENGTSLRYLKIHYGWLSAFNDQMKGQDLTPSRSIVIEETLTAYSRLRTLPSEHLRDKLETLDVLRQQHLEILLENFDVVGQDVFVPRQDVLQPQVHWYGVMLEGMFAYSDLLCIHPNLRNISAHWVSIANRLANVDLTATTSGQSHRRILGLADYLRVRLARLEYALGAFDSSLHPSFKGTAQILQKMLPSGKADLLYHYQETVSTLGRQQKEDLLMYLVNNEQSEYLDQEAMEVLQRTVFSLKDGDLDSLRPTLSQVFSCLCNNMLQANDPKTSILSMQCMNDLLQRSYRVLSQWDIDSLIANVTIKASQLQSPTAPQKAPLCYLGLCKLLTTVFSRHRSMIGERYHLILPALQSLLRCLFVPYNLTDSDDQSSAFTNVHASSYSGLLTALADPTISSVTTSKKRSKLNLNDETRKAKSIAGQHLPYLIMEYCMCQLSGRLTPEIKAALEPGIFAVLRVMTKERMRTMNAALSESGRAVWKGLYEEWTRAGR